MLSWIKRHPLLSIGALVSSLLVGIFFGSLFIQVVREVCQKDEFSGAKDCVDYHLGPWAVILIAEFVDAHNGVVTAIGTIAVALFTLTLWRTSDRQAALTREAVDDAKRQAVYNEKAANAAAKSADAAVESNRINRELFVEANRPRITVENVSVSDLSGDSAIVHPDGKLQVNVGVWFKNRGRGPADLTSVHIEGRVPEISFNTEIEERRFADHVRTDILPHYPFRQNLLAGDTSMNALAVYLTKDDVERFVLSGWSVFFAVGVIFYSYKLGGSLHEFRFNLQIAPTIDKTLLRKPGRLPASAFIAKIGAHMGTST
jgi:hypothetical protein